MVVQENSALEGTAGQHKRSSPHLLSHGLCVELNKDRAPEVLGGDAAPHSHAPDGCNNVEELSQAFQGAVKWQRCHKDCAIVHLRQCLRLGLQWELPLDRQPVLADVQLL